MKTYLLSLILHLLLVGLVWTGMSFRKTASSSIDQVSFNGASPAKQAPLPQTRKSSAPAQASVHAGPPANANVEESKNGVLPADSYLLLVRQKIQAQQIYPRSALRQGQEATVEMAIEISETGEVIRNDVISPGNPTIFVEAAREAIRRASPLPPPPPGFARKFAIPIVFQVSR